MAGSFATAHRMEKIDASGIRKVFDLAASMADPINLSIGQPHFDVPDPIKRAAIDAINSGLNSYTPTQGSARLREAVQRQLRIELGHKVDVPLLITSGVSGALALAMAALIDPGDEVVMLDPYFVMYKHLVNLVGGVPVFVPCRDDFRPDVQSIADALTDKTKLLILNSPCNPTGSVYSRTDLQQIADVARRRELLVLSDEIYNFFCYDEPFVSLASLYENTLLMRGFSKSYAMTGWRLGWCTGPKNVIDKMTMLQQYSFVCAPSMVQEAGVAAIGVDMSHEVAAYRRKRDMVFAALGESFGLHKPGGAFYAFVPAPAGKTASDFVAAAIGRRVLTIPGNVFSQKDTHFRLSYATTDEKLAEGLDILRQLA